uniref:Uncharacterized protein n=1 Tax=Anguilla anguilla TaxID=7936 RepID=A0A0E9UUU9_ANGAN
MEPRESVWLDVQCIRKSFLRGPRSR